MARRSLLVLEVCGLLLLLLRSICGQQQQPSWLQQQGGVDSFVSEEAVTLDQLDPRCWVGNG